MSIQATALVRAIRVPSRPIRWPVILAALLVLASTPAAAAPPLQIEFQSGTVLVRGAAPGARTAWMALLRERTGWHITVRVHRGLAVAASDGVARIEHAAAASCCAVWAVASLDGAGIGRGTPPDYGMSRIAVPIHAAAGANAISVEAPEVRLLFVRSPMGAWAFDAADGSQLDADGRADGRVTIALTALRPVERGPAPPDRIASGDVIIAIDPRHVRMGEVAVP